MSLPLALFKLNDEIYYMNKYIFNIGRGNAARGVDLSIVDNNFISRNHLSISFVDNIFSVKCLSKNGILVDGVLLMENVHPHKITDKCSFRFPSTDVVVHFESLVRPPLKSFPAVPSTVFSPALSTAPPSIASDKFDPMSKPPYSYAQLIAQAIGMSPQKRATLSEIYSYITNNYPFFSAGDRSWQNSIRHNLSLSPNFIRVSRSPNDLGKGSYWCFEPSADNFLMSSAFMKRRSTMRKNYKKSFPLTDSAPASPVQSRPAKFMKVKHTQSAPASPAVRLVYDQVEDRSD